MGDKTKSFEFIQTRLRSANEIFRKGGHVTRIYSDRNFRMHYDNRRIVLVPEELEGVAFLTLSPSPTRVKVTGSPNRTGLIY